MRYLLPFLCAGLALLSPACSQDGNFTIFGYTTGTNYDRNIHTVHVPIFENRTFYRGMEFQLTQAVVDAINKNTPYRVVGADTPADTELRGAITVVTKGLLNVDPLNETREAETTITVELAWIDLRNGEILSRPARRPGAPAAAEQIVVPGVGNGVPGIVQPVPIGPATAPIGPQVAAVGDQAPPPPPVPGTPPPKPPVITLKAVSSFVPELGQSTTTGFQSAINKMAIMIVDVMEKPW